MKSHDWIFLMFTTIICCMTIKTIAQAQQRGRVKFGVSMQKDDVDTNSSPEIVSIANQARGSASHRASSRFRAAIPSAIPATIEENKESPRPVQRGSRGRANDRSSRKLTAEATEAIPLVRSRKRINQVATSSDQPIKIELPTSNIDRTNVIRRTKTRSEPASSTSPSPTTSGSIRRRSDLPSDEPSIESVRKVRTFTSRSVTKQASAEVVSSENPLTVATTGGNWRNVAIKRGASKVKSSERKSKALDEDQLEDENYPEHFKLLLRKQQPSPDLLPKNYPKLPVQEEQTYSKLNEVYEAPRVQGRLRRLEQTSQETSDEILQVSRAIPKVRRVELKREDTARAALKTRRIEPPRLEENIESSFRNEEPPKSRRSDAEKLRAQVKINKAAIKSRRKESSNEEQREDIPKVPLKSNRRTESLTEDNGAEVKRNEIEESTKASKTLFLPRRAEPYRPKPKTTTQRPTTTSKPIKKPEVLAARTKFKNRFNSRLQFPSLRTKTSSTSDEIVKYDNEVVHTSPAPQPVRPLQITKSRNLALDRPVVDARPKPKQHKFSSRYRGDAFSRYQQKPEPSKPIYTPTIPALTTEPIPPQLDQVTPHNLENHDLKKSGSNFQGIVYDGKAGVWNMVEPVAGGLTRSEIIVDSGGEEQPLAQSSVTVSIFEALADILSKTPSTTTSTTTTTTTSTTTSTTELPDIIQVPEQKIDSISSTTVNTHDPITDVMDDENSTITNAITNNDRDGRLLNSVEINPSTTLSIDTSDSLETITVPEYTSSSDTTLLFRSQTEQTTLEFTDFTTLSLPASPTQATLTNTNLTNISTNLLELTTLASNPSTSLPMPFLADALTTPGSSLITTPLLISAISNFLDTSVQNASETMATTTENTTKTTTTATLDTNSTPTDASTTLSPPITTTFSPPSTGSPPVTISFLDLFTIQAKKVNPNTEPAVEVHPIYKGPESTTTPVGVEKKQTTGPPVNINTFFGTQTYPSISISGSTSTDRTLELSSTFSENPKVTGGETTDTTISPTSTLEQDTSTPDYITSPQSSIRTQSLPIHLNSILGSTQKYDQTSPFKTVQTEITTTIRSRFGNRRIPILPAGSVQSTTNKISTSTQTSSTTTPVSTTKITVTQVSPENNQQQQQLSNFTTTTSSITTTTEQKPIQDFSVYGILPNNTVVRKRPPQVSRQLDVGIMVYGILPNQTVVRKYPNGTLMIVDSSKDVEVVDIDPKMLFNPFSELYRTSQSSLLLTTHRSTTSHRLIESNHILSSSSSSSSSSSTEVPNNSATGSGRRGNSIKETTESGNTDSALTTNTDDENLIQWLSENEDNILNSTILFESNTENAVLLDLLKRKYIKTDLPSRSSNVVSLTTVRNVIEENSIQANKEEDASENTLFDSSEEKKKDSVDDFLLSKGSVVPNRNNSNDDENVISKQFDTSYANVGIGSIFAGNKGRKFDNSQRTKLYPIKYEMAIPNTTTKLFPIHTFSSSTMHKANHTLQKEFLAEVVNRTHGVVVENPIEGLETATPKRDGESKIIDFGILESEVDSEANGDYFMDPEDRLKIIDDGFDFDTGEGSGNSNDDDDDGEFKGFDKTGNYHTNASLDEPKTDFVDIETSPILGKSVNSTDVNVSLSGEKADSDAFKVDSATSTILSDSENGNIESPFVHIVFPEGVLESSEKFSDIYTTVSPLRNTSSLFESEYLIPSSDMKEKPTKTSQTQNVGNTVFSQDLTTLSLNLDKVSGNKDYFLHDTTTFRPTTSDGKDDSLGIDFSNLPFDIKNVSIDFENSSKSYDKKFANNFVSDFKNVTISLADDGDVGLKNESFSDSYQSNLAPNGSKYETKSGGFFGSDSKISDDLDSNHSYAFDNSSTKNTNNIFASVKSSEEINSGTILNSNNSSESEIMSSYSLNFSKVFEISDWNKNEPKTKVPDVQTSDNELNQDNFFFTSLNGTENISENYFQNKSSVSEASSTNLNDSLILQDPNTLFSSDNYNINTSSIFAMTNNENLYDNSPQENNSKILTSDVDFETLEVNGHLNPEINFEIPQEQESSKATSANRNLEFESIRAGMAPILNASLIFHDTKGQSSSSNIENESDKETISFESIINTNADGSFNRSFPPNNSLLQTSYFDSKTLEGNITSSNINIEKDFEGLKDHKPMTENIEMESEISSENEKLKSQNIQAGIFAVSKDSVINFDSKNLSLSRENANTYKPAISMEDVTNLSENERSNDLFSHGNFSELLNTNVDSKTIEENNVLSQLNIEKDSKISTEFDSFNESSANINLKPEIKPPFNLTTSKILTTASNDEFFSVGSPVFHPNTVTLDELVGMSEFQSNFTETLPSTKTKMIESADTDLNSLSLQGLQSTSNSSEIISSLTEFPPEVLVIGEELSPRNHTENNIVHEDIDSQTITVDSKDNNSETTPGSLSKLSNSTIDSEVYQMEKPLADVSVRTISNEEQIFQTESPESNELNSNIDSNLSNDLNERKVILNALNENLSPSQKQQEISEMAIESLSDLSSATVTFNENLSSLNERNKSNNLTVELKNEVPRDSSVGLSIYENEPISSTVKVETIQVSKLDDLNATEFQSHFIEDLNLSGKPSSTETPIDLFKMDGFQTLNENEDDSVMNNQTLEIGSFVEVTKFLNLSKEFTSTESFTDLVKSIERVEDSSSKQVDSSVPNNRDSQKLGMQNSVTNNSTKNSAFGFDIDELKSTRTTEIEALHVLKPDQTNDDEITQSVNDIVYSKSSSTENSIELNKNIEPSLSNGEEDSYNQVDSITNSHTNNVHVNTFSTTSTPFEVTSSSDITSDIELKVSEKLGDEFYLPTSDNQQNENKAGIDSKTPEGTAGTLIPKNQIPSPDSAVVEESDQLGIKNEATFNNSIVNDQFSASNTSDSSYITLSVDDFFQQFEEQEVLHPNPSLNNNNPQNELPDASLETNLKQLEESKSKNNSSANIDIDEITEGRMLKNEKTSIPVINVRNETELLESSNLDSLKIPEVKVFVYNFNDEQTEKPFGVETFDPPNNSNILKFNSSLVSPKPLLIEQYNNYVPTVSTDKDIRTTSYHISSSETSISSSTTQAPNLGTSLESSNLEYSVPKTVQNEINLFTNSNSHVKALEVLPELRDVTLPDLVINVRNETEIIESPNLDSLKIPEVQVFIYNFNDEHTEKPFSISDYTTQSGRVDENLGAQKSREKATNTSYSQENFGEFVSQKVANKTNGFHDSEFENENLTNDSSTLPEFTTKSEKSDKRFPTSFNTNGNESTELAQELLNSTQPSSEDLGTLGSNNTQSYTYVSKTFVNDSKSTLAESNNSEGSKDVIFQNVKYSEYSNFKEENQLEKQGFNSSLGNATNSVIISQKTEGLTGNVPKDSSHISNIPEDNAMTVEAPKLQTEMNISSEKNSINIVNISQNNEINNRTNFEPSGKNEFLNDSQKEYPGTVQVEIVQKNNSENTSVEVSDQHNSSNAQIDYNSVKSTDILERPAPSRDQVFKINLNTQENGLSLNDSKSKNKTSSGEVWTSSISSEIVEKGSLYQSQLTSNLSLENSSLYSKQNYSVQNNGSEGFSPSSPLESEVRVSSIENKTNLFSSENETGNVLSSNTSNSLKTEKEIANSKPQIFENPLLFSKSNVSSSDGNNTIPSFIKSQFDSVFNIGQELTKTEDTFSNKTSEEPITISTKVSQPIFLDPIIKTLNISFGSGITDKDLETDQHVVPRKGAFLNSTEELGSALLENSVPIIDLSEIISSSTDSILETEASNKNNEEILRSELLSAKGGSQNFLLPNISRELSKEALYSYNQIKEDGVESSDTPNNSNTLKLNSSSVSPKPLVIEQYKNFVPTVSIDEDIRITNSYISSSETSISSTTTQAPNLGTSLESFELEDSVPKSVENEINLFQNSNVDTLEVLPELRPVTLPKPPIMSTIQKTFAPIMFHLDEILIASNEKNGVSSSIEVGSEHEVKYSTQIPILQSANQILEQQFATSSVRPAPSKADKDRVSKIILELLNKSEQHARNISDDTVISSTNIMGENSPRNSHDSSVFEKSSLNLSDSFDTKLNISQNPSKTKSKEISTHFSDLLPMTKDDDFEQNSQRSTEVSKKDGSLKIGSQISGFKSESKDYEDIKTQQNLISEQQSINTVNIVTSSNFDEEQSESSTVTPKSALSSLTTKNIFVVSSIPSAYSAVTASYEEFSKPPAVFYPVNSSKSTTPSSQVKAAIITPTNIHAESSAEPDLVSMIFPKDFIPTLNMALPGSLNQKYTKESLHKPLLNLKPSNNKNLHQESLTKPNSNYVKSPQEREFNSPLKPPSYFKESSSSSDKTNTMTTLGTKSFVETTTATLAEDKVQKVPLFVPGGVPIELMSNTDSFMLPIMSSKQTIQETVKLTGNKFVPGGVPRDLLQGMRTLPVFTADTPLGEIFGHLPSNNVLPVHVQSSTTLAPLKATDNTFHKTYQFNLKMLKSTIEKVENDVKVLKETFIKSLNKSTNLIDPLEEKLNKLNSLRNSSKTIEDSSNKSNDFKGFKSESLTKHNIAPVEQLDLLQETLNPALDSRSVSNAPQNLVENSKFNLQTMMKNSEFKPSNSNPVYQMSANALANAQTINSIMSESADGSSVSKSNAHLKINNDVSKMVFNTNSGQNLYNTVPFSETPQQLPSSEMNVESWTKLTPSEVTYSPIRNIEAHNQKHTETQYTIQQQNMYQESSTISSLENSFVIDNFKNSINTIAEPKQVDRQTTPTIYLVTPAPMRTTTQMPTTPSSTTPSTTTPSSTTPSSTTTTTTPSTTTTSSTTQSTTTSTTTPITTTTTSTTTTPIPIIPEISTTTPKPTIVFKAPSTTSSTIVTSQSPPQTNTASTGANSELEKNIKLLEQLLQLQASLKPKPSSSSTTTTTTSTPSSTTTTTKATEEPIKAIAASSADDEQFINQLRQLLLSQQQATKKPTTLTTTPTPTTTTTSTTTIRKPITISPQNLQDLLNSFSTPSFTSTTAKPIPNVNDIQFLNSLREIGKFPATTSAPTTFANRIIELALKNRPAAKPTSPVFISTTVPPFVPMPQVKFPQILPSNEIENHHQDQASLSADLSLLSTLLGRRITIADLPQITQQFGGNRAKPAPVPFPLPKTTTTTTTPRTTRRTTTTTDRPMTRDEIAEIEKNLNLLSTLLGRPVSLNELPLIMQELRSGRKPKGTASSGATINFITPSPFKTTTTTVHPRLDVSLPSQTPISQEEVIELLKDPSLGSPEQLNIYGQSNDAILAAVLKQRGIGPVHNNLPINDLFTQEQTQRPYRPTRPRPPPPPPPPQRRPVIDGLAWLWRTWQETGAPGNRVSKNNRQPTASASTRLESPLLVGAFGGDTPTPTVNSNEGGEYADLQYPQNPSFGQGNGLLTAAFGVTRAVSQFLGAAFQGAAKSVQSAFSPQAIQQPSLISLSG